MSVVKASPGTPIKVTFIDKVNSHVVEMPVGNRTGYGMQRSDFTARCAEATAKSMFTHWIEPFHTVDHVEPSWAAYSTKGYLRSFGPGQLDAAVMWVLHNDKA